MNVLLLKDVNRLGKQGEVVDVSPGYARNFLFPRNLALSVTEGNQKTLDEIKKQHLFKKDRQDKETQTLAGRLRNATVRLAVRSGEKGKLFGAVTSSDIARALHLQENIAIDKKQIKLKDSIRSHGEHTVMVHLAGQDVPLKVVVEGKELENLKIKS